MYDVKYPYSFSGSTFCFRLLDYRSQRRSPSTPPDRRSCVRDSAGSRVPKSKVREVLENAQPRTFM